MVRAPSVMIEEKLGVEHINQIGLIWFLKRNKTSIQYHYMCEKIDRRNVDNK